MPRDYYPDDRRDLSHQRDRYTKSSRREDRNDMRQSSAVPLDPRADPRYPMDYYDPYARDRERTHASVTHDRGYDRPSLREDRDYQYDDFDQGPERKKKSKKSKKQKYSKDRTVDDRSDHQNRSLVAAYDDISSDSDIAAADSHRHSGRRDYDRSRAKSPSSAIREYRTIKERSHSNSPLVLQRSPDHRKSKTRKQPRAVSPEVTRRTDRGHGDSRRPDYDRDQSPVHPPSPKKARLKSPRSPSSPNHRSVIYSFVFKLWCRQLAFRVWFAVQL